MCSRQVLRELLDADTDADRDAGGVVTGVVDGNPFGDGVVTATAKETLARGKHYFGVCRPDAPYCDGYTDGVQMVDMRPKMNKMHRRMALVALTSDFGRPVRPMLPSAGTSGVVCANWTCEDFLHFARTVAVLVFG
eukprot:jgi/Tetstr1/446098/TSEL_033698.t1